MSYVCTGCPFTADEPVDHGYRYPRIPVPGFHQHTAAMMVPAGPHTYVCPSGHRWTTGHAEGPRVNIKCPSCQQTGFRENVGKPVRYPEHVQPLRTLTADVPIDPTTATSEEDRRDA